MRIRVAGDWKTPILLDTDQATAILIDTEDGKPAVIYKIIENGYLRLHRGEDKNFDTIAKQLGLI